MLVLTKFLIDQPVMSLRTGGRVATVRQAIIDPTKLKIEGFYCTDSLEKNKVLVLVNRDIRDVLPAGFVVNDHEVLTEPEDLVRLKKILDWDYQLIGKVVVTERKKKLGKVVDFATEPESMIIKKLYVTQSIVRSIANGSLSIDRNQVVEITHNKIIIKDPLQPVKVQSAKATSPVVSPAPAT
jgi:uncharacterized protein YrrD